jgi:hypothetical protein
MNIKQQAVLTHENKTLIGIHRTLLTLHGEDTVEISAVRLWVRNSRNSAGNLDRNNQLRSGRPVTAHRYANSQTFDELIRKNR